MTNFFNAVSADDHCGALMKTFNLADIRAQSPCYDPIEYAIVETWTGTAIDILNAKNVPAKDRIWLVLRLYPQIAKRFADKCVTRAKSYAANAAYAYAAAYAAAQAAYAAERTKQIKSLAMLVRQYDKR